MMIGLEVVLVLMFAGAISASPAKAGPYVQSADAERGKQVYLKYGCYQCHGRQGQGSAAGARLAPAPMAFAAFARYVRQPRGEMPPYTARVVTDQELADIHAFLRSVPRPPAVAALPFDE
jgi:ubiquinol-cytochrome c reductase cytochrome c subunit